MDSRYDPFYNLSLKFQLKAELYITNIIGSLVKTLIRGGTIHLSLDSIRLPIQGMTIPIFSIRLFLCIFCIKLTFLTTILFLYSDNTVTHYQFQGCVWVCSY